jgi:hypothetical protein
MTHLCFLLSLLDTCTMTLRERVNCGYSGITAEECTSRGCCFNDRTMGYPWCFHPLAIENPEEGMSSHFF